MNHLKEQLKKIWYYIKAAIIAILISAGILYYVAPASVIQLVPGFSWWSAALFSDNKSSSIITEVESSGHNMRNVQYIDAFGRVCTNSYANAGTGLDCDYPPQERKDWTIEDYRKKLK